MCRKGVNNNFYFRAESGNLQMRQHKNKCPFVVTDKVCPIPRSGLKFPLPATVCTITGKTSAAPLFLSIGATLKPTRQLKSKLGLSANVFRN